MDTERGWDERTWRRMCVELGLAGLAAPEEYGGGSGSAVELGVVFEEAGRSLVTAPLLATAALAVPLLLAIDDPVANADYLPGICDGSTVATVVTSDSKDAWVPDGLGVQAREAGGSALLNGEAPFVVDGAYADLVLVPARTADGVGVFVVDKNADGFRANSLVTLDQTRKQAALSFSETPARRIGAPDSAAAVRRAMNVARALLANEQVGAAARCLELTVEYAKTRVQFGRPIGSFQAIKQKLADMLILVESARSAAVAAAGAAAGVPDAPDLEVAAAVAQSYCSEAFVTVASEMIQLHGGIGFTWEHDAHLYFKRAWTSREFLGRPEEHLDTLACRFAETVGSH